MDVDKYLNKLEYRGPKTPTIKVLKELHFLHVTHIPFDTLNIFGGPEKILDLEVIYDMFVNKNRGGFCYELNGLFYWLLKKLGFNVHMLNARAFQPEKDEFLSDFDHMALMVYFDDGETWFADVGWGGNSIAMPIKFANMESQIQKSGTFRIRQIPDFTNEYYFEKKRQKMINPAGEVVNEEKEKNSKYQVSGWELLFKFKLQSHVLSDYTVACARMQVEPGLLTSTWFIIKHTPNGRILIYDNKLYERIYVDEDTVISKQTSLTKEGVYKSISEHFGFRLDFELSI